MPKPSKEPDYANIRLPGETESNTQGATSGGAAPWLDALPATLSMGGAGLGAGLGLPALATGPWGAVVPAGLAVSLGGLGGGVGQTIREGGYRLMGYGDAPGTINGATREGATMSALGEALGPAVSRGAQAAYEGLLRPTLRQLRANPAVAELAWKLGYPLTAPGRNTAIRDAQMASMAEADRMAAQADVPATRVTEPGREIPPMVIPPAPKPPVRFEQQNRTIPPSILDLAENARKNQEFVASVQMFAKRHGISVDTAWALVNKPKLDIGDYATAWDRLGIKGPDLDELRALRPGPAPQATNEVLMVPVQDPSPRPGFTSVPGRTIPPTVVTERGGIPVSVVDDAEKEFLKRFKNDATGANREAAREFFKDVRAEWDGKATDGLFTYTNAMGIKRHADELASPVYRANLSRTAPNTAKPDAYYEAAKALADRLRGKLAEALPGISGVNARTSRLAAVGDVLEETMQPRPKHSILDRSYVGHGAVPLAAGGAGAAAFGQLGMDPYLGFGAGALTGNYVMENMRPQLSRAFLFMGKSPVAQRGVAAIPQVADYLLGYPFNPNQMYVNAGVEEPDYSSITLPNERR